MKLNIQLFGGRGASSSEGSRKRGTGSGFLGEEKGGFLSNGTRYFAGDKVVKSGKEYTVIEISKTGKSMEIYNGDETIKVFNDNKIALKERGQAGQSLLARQRVNVARGADSGVKMNGRVVPVYNEAPKGFVKTNGATTAPKGYEWYSNNKNLFGDERINILVRKRK